MKPSFRFLLAVAFTTAATAAQAQISVGPRVGLNATEFSAESFPDDGYRYAPQFGVTAHVGLGGGNWAVQPAVLYTQKGWHRESGYSSAVGSTVTVYDVESTLKLHYLELPVNFVYTTGSTEGFQVFAGPYAGFGLNGKFNVATSTNGAGAAEDNSAVVFASEQGNDDDKVYVRRLDVGVNVGVGYKLGPLQAQLGYGRGVRNLIPTDKDGVSPTGKAFNHAIQLSVAYLFGL